jgi:hypothetical protein
MLSKATARLGSIREKHDHKNSPPDNEQRRDEPDFEPSLLSLARSLEPAPIDIVGFGKRLAEIIAKAIRASHTRSKSRK